MFIPRLRRLLGFYAVRENDPVLAAAQFQALARQILMLYAFLGLNAVGLAYAHYGLAPDWVVVGPPVVLVVAVCARSLGWIRTARRPLQGKEAIARLRMVNRFTAILGIGASLWASLLFGHGNSASDMHIIFFLTITMMFCMQCLAHLRSAAHILATIAVPYCVYFIAVGEPLVQMAVISYVLVLVGSTAMQSFAYRDFCHLVDLTAENGRLAHTDALTGLPNRRSFVARLEETVTQAAATGAQFGVGMIDLDGFKPVNDSLGHGAGDSVLREVARRLEGAGIGWAARLGGDEFGIIVEGEGDLDGLGRRICSLLGQPYALREGMAQIGASVGFARFPEAAASAETLVERADFALYHAKAFHRGKAVLFAPDHEAALRRHAAVEQALRRADLATEFHLLYQPIVDVAGGQVEAYEALARWNSPTLGAVSPADFIPVAERSGLILDLTRVLLAKALDAVRGWPADRRLSFNLSAHDIATPESVEALIALVGASGIDPSRIVFEVTETGLMRDLGDARRALSALKSLGPCIALDDFGTGYSSLSYLKRLPVDRLKIDRSFVTQLDGDETSLAIVRAILDLCRHLSLDCIVEGVETTEQMLLLRSIGCRSMQGYLFGKPMPSGEIAAFEAMVAGRSIPVAAAPPRAPARKVDAGFREKPMRHKCIENRPGSEIQDDSLVRVCPRWRDGDEAGAAG
ncbi:MAG: EAL domain-containing protein [Methylorubrum rhodinum]|uniref:putative bifunctional diguanylate cyclase/phosphodiesterase n=1 Tax=Methylorubrum rhodinum TaxID=29428 RepID=UPI003BB187CB